MKIINRTGGYVCASFEGDNIVLSDEIEAEYLTLNNYIEIKGNLACYKKHSDDLMELTTFVSELGIGDIGDSTVDVVIRELTEKHKESIMIKKILGVLENGGGKLNSDVAKDVYKELKDVL